MPNLRAAICIDNGPQPDSCDWCGESITGSRMLNLKTVALIKANAIKNMADDIALGQMRLSDGDLAKLLWEHAAELREAALREPDHA
jgi:hypothetical protein